jgi:hypothetical protein
MSIRDNKDGTVTIEYRDGAGKRHRETFVGIKRFGKEVERKRKTEIAEGKFFPERVKGKITFRDIADKYWEVRGSKTKSARNWRYMLDGILEIFGNMEVKNITTDDIQDFYDSKADEASPSTANRYLTLMLAIINKSLKLRIYKGVDPTIGVEKDRDNPSRIIFLKADEINTLLS